MSLLVCSPVATCDCIIGVGCTASGATSCTCDLRCQLKHFSQCRDVAPIGNRSSGVQGLRLSRRKGTHVTFGGRSCDRSELHVLWSTPLVRHHYGRLLLARLWGVRSVLLCGIILYRLIRERRSVRRGCLTWSVVGVRRYRVDLRLRGVKLRRLLSGSVWYRCRPVGVCDLLLLLSQS